MKLRFRYAPPPLDRAAWLPLGLALALALAVVVQVLAVDEPELPAAGPPPAGRHGAIAAPAVAAAPVAPVILARSMFAPGTAPPGSADGAAARTGPLGGAVIVGSVRIGRIGYAVVQGPGAGTRNVRIGGRIAGWRLRGFSGSQALLARGGEALTVPLGTSPPATMNSGGEENQ